MSAVSVYATYVPYATYLPYATHVPSLAPLSKCCVYAHPLWERGPGGEGSISPGGEGQNRPQQRHMGNAGEEQRLGLRSHPLALQQRVQLIPDAGVIQDAEPTGNDCAIGIDQEILGLRRGPKLGSLGVVLSVVNIQDDKLDPPGVVFLQPTHGRLIAAAGRSPGCPRLKEGESRRARLGNRRWRRSSSPSGITGQEGPHRGASAERERPDKHYHDQSDC